ncbi:MAG: hypothetical protein AAF649_06110 [Verrucomicrobiota bacterium]
MANSRGATLMQLKSVDNRLSKVLLKTLNQLTLHYMKKTHLISLLYMLIVGGSVIAAKSAIARPDLPVSPDRTDGSECGEEPIGHDCE